MNRRGPYAKGIAKREEIIAAALDTVARVGCRNASNREIADRVGLSQAGLMHYFGSREELLVAVLAARDERDYQLRFAENPTFDGYIDIIVNNTTVPGLVQLYVEYSAEATIPPHPAHEFFAQRFVRVRSLLAGVIERARDAGEFGPALHPANAADLVIAASDGLQVQWLVNRSIDMAERLRELWAALRQVSLSGAARL
ncbi:MAG: TetR family transcriptional regulator [Leucobacter sp.]